MAELIVDFSHGDVAAKRAFLHAHADRKVVMDLSCADPQVFYGEFPQLVGAFPGQFAMAGKVELHLREEILGVEAALFARGLTAVRTSLVGLGFTVPRTLVMIVNEAYHALAEGVASRSDIDRAMVFGVNYPGGPFSWAEGRKRIFVELLAALARAHGGQRYEANSLLLEESRTED